MAEIPIARSQNLVQSLPKRVKPVVRAKLQRDMFPVDLAMMIPEWKEVGNETSLKMASQFIQVPCGDRHLLLDVLDVFYLYLNCKVCGQWSGVSPN